VTENRKRPQERLARELETLPESAVPYRQFVDDSPLGIMVIQNGIIKFVNVALGALVGYRPEEVIGKPYLSFLVEEDRPGSAAAHERRMRGQAVPALAECRIIARNGKVHHWLMTTRTIDWQGLAAYSLVTDITELKRTEKELERSAYFDALTGLPNRLLLADRLRQGLKQTSRNKQLLAICYMDIDGFKPINDTWGHEAGDRLLAEMAARLQMCLRGGDTVARLGGDEFVLLLLDLNHVEECEGALARVLAAIAQPVMIEGKPVTLSASIGVNIYPFDSKDPEVLLRQADEAMYVAKASGRNRYCFFKPEQVRSLTSKLSKCRIIARNGKVRHWLKPARTVDWQGLTAYSLMTDITELKRTEKELERSAYFDALTGLPNRILLADRLRHGLKQTSRNRHMLAICYMDIDGFKPINDTWGHEAGDRLLAEMAARLQMCLRGGDTVARLGGDEFVLLLHDLKHAEECEIALARVLAAIAQPVMVKGKPVTLSASIGVNIYPFDSKDPEVLLRQADKAMYVAKASGGNRYCFFKPEQIKGDSD
jgi:diguanylate cyclase (GGDEF)-like protein/PAS domain S-box-containing protein